LFFASRSFFKDSTAPFDPDAEDVLSSFLPPSLVALSAALEFFSAAEASDEYNLRPVNVDIGAAVNGIDRLDDNFVPR
jgi:hypothetical protein